jgi:Cation transporting ATPase, C-terminus
MGGGVLINEISGIQRRNLFSRIEPSPFYSWSRPTGKDNFYAILWELVLLALIIYLPFLCVPFGTFSLPLVDRIIIVGLALTVSPVQELAKWMVIS